MNRRTLAITAAILVVLGIFAMGALFTVAQTQQALLLQFGKPQRVIRGPGLHVKWPFIQEAVLFDTRLLDVEPPPEEVIASDQKRLVVDTYTRYRITDPLLFYQTVGNEEAARDRLIAMVSSSMRQVIGNVPLSALLSVKRAAIMHQIRDEVMAAAKPFGVEVIDTRIRSALLPAQNSEAIYARMNSERHQQAALFRAEGSQAAAVVRANADRESTVILAEANKQSQGLRGEGDAIAIAVYAKAYGKDTSFFAFYRSLEAYRRAFTGKGTSFVLSPTSSFFKYFVSPNATPAANPPPAPAGAPSPSKSPAPSRPHG